MATDRYSIDNFKRYLLNRTTVTPVIVECIENCLTNEEETATQSFHKIMIHHWQDSLGQLFDVISGYFGSAFIPVSCTSQGELTTFYTANLNIVMKIVKFDFMFPYCRNMFNIDILFNDRVATDFFLSLTTVEEIVSGVVSRRFNDKCELDLSNICEDPEFLSNKIWFYKLSLLSQFKILMLRMGRDTKKLILRNNNLSQPPVDILNFFIKADLTAIDLSHNNIPSLQELHRMSSKIEKLWLEGNPLCDELDPVSYVKNITIKFPRLTELDGVKFNQHGVIVPFFKNYIATPDKRTQLIADKFVNLYFSNYDYIKGHKRVFPFYEENATFSITTDFNELEQIPHFANFYRNILNPEHKALLNKKKNKLFKSALSIMSIYAIFPETIHDKNTFTVDVLCHNQKVMMLVVDGIFKEIVTKKRPVEYIYQFRRTFLLNIHNKNNESKYSIQHEMLNVLFATDEQIKNSFKTRKVNINSLTPLTPTIEDTEAICKAFQHLTQLKRSEAELILKYHSWNIQAALYDFMTKLKLNKIPAHRFAEEDDFSDTSSLLDEMID